MAESTVSGASAASSFNFKNTIGQMVQRNASDLLLKVGGRVTPGQTVCIIEAMKIMNEIEAEITGVVREILVDDAQPVEFGQVLYRVDPHG